MRSHTSQTNLTRRQGFTVVELMVVLFVITILLAILIPAVQQSRVSASQIQCRARLKQIGIALHGHEATYGKFPSFLNDGFSWHVSLLPYLELSGIRDRLDLTQTAIDAVNEDAENMSVEAYCCPSDPSRQLRCVNYIGNAGTGFATWNGFFSDRALNAGDFVDGISNTAAVSECCGGGMDQPFEFIASGRMNSRSEWRRFVKDCEASGSNKWPPGNFIGRGWLVGGYPTTNYAHILPPGSNSCKPHGDVLRYSVATPRSYHSSGVNVLMGDGSVQFVSKSVDRNVWRQQGSRDSSEFFLEDE